MGKQPGKAFSAWIRPLRYCWKPIALLWVGIIFGIFCSTFAAWLITKHKLWDVSDTPLAWLGDHLALVLPLAGALLVFTGLAGLASFQSALQQAVQAAPLSSPPPARTQQNRARMRERLAQWYQDFLVASLEKANWLDLGLAEKPDALYTPLSLTMRDSHVPERPLPPGTSIMQAYEEAHQRLLILGEPGSGKSTLLYLLAQHLLALTETNQAAPLPIVFALSSWAQQRSPLEEWMVEQLVQVYKVPQRVAQQWVQDQQIIPLLDGLDEMEAGARPLCVAAINCYHTEHPHPLVVCSRSSEYEVASQRERLFLQRAVVVQPLSPIQVASTLLRGGEPLAGLYGAYQANPALQELSTTPLLLNLLILAYQGTTIHELSATPETLQQQVLERYVQRMVERKGDPARYPLEVTIPWLTFLARQMRARNQTVFAIELLQPNWLPGGQRWLYYGSAGVPYALLLLITGLITRQLIVLSTGLLGGLLMGLRAMQRGEGRGEPGDREARRRGEEEIIQLAQQRQGQERGDRGELLGNLRDTLLGGLLIGAPFGVLVGLFVGLSLGVRSGLLIGVPLGVFGGIVFALDGFFRYYTLRLWFWRAGLFPFRAIAFLEDACARHLLKRVGSSYQFMHRLLLDFFAERQSL